MGAVAGMDKRQIANEAAEWLFRLEDHPEEEASPEFVAWLRQSPRHMGEFLFATAALKLVQTGDPERRIEIEDLGGSAAGEIIPLTQPSPPVQDTARPRPARIGWAVAAAVVLALGLIAGPFLLRNEGDYRTQVGEQRSFKLDDGSMLYLNTQSRAQVVYSKNAREVRLLGGEALFVVAPDDRRPFTVQTGAVTIQALGTQFNVYRRRDAITVSVAEGRVKVFSGQGRQPPQVSTDALSSSATAVLEAGEEAKVSRDNRIAKRAVRDLGSALAWRQRRLVFEATPLEDVAREFNRYNRAQFQIEDSAAAMLQITGVFNADEPQALVNFLRDDPALQIRASGDGVAIASRREREN